MLLDNSFYYDEKGFLRNHGSDNDKESMRIMNLFHGLTRAKKKMALVVVDNMDLIERIYNILQR
jgi:hypothetical protein